MNEFSVVVVRRDDLEEYMTDYHHRSANDTCKADHEPWPCEIYTRLKKALEN